MTKIEDIMDLVANFGDAARATGEEPGLFSPLMMAQERFKSVETAVVAAIALPVTENDIRRIVRWHRVASDQGQTVPGDQAALDRLLSIIPALQERKETS